jgi:hypothetical protein
MPCGDKPGLNSDEIIASSTRSDLSRIQLAAIGSPKKFLG